MSQHTHIPSCNNPKSRSFDLRNIIRNNRKTRLQEQAHNEVPELSNDNPSLSYQRKITTGRRTSCKIAHQRYEPKVPNLKRIPKPFRRNNQDKFVKFNASQKHPKNAARKIRRVIYDSSDITVRRNEKPITDSQAFVRVSNDKEVIINKTYKWQRKTISSDTKGNQRATLENHSPVLRPIELLLKNCSSQVTVKEVIVAVQSERHQSLHVQKAEYQKEEVHSSPLKKENQEMLKYLEDQQRQITAAAFEKLADQFAKFSLY